MLMLKNYVRQLCHVSKDLTTLTMGGLNIDFRVQAVKRRESVLKILDENGKKKLEKLEMIENGKTVFTKLQITTLIMSSFNQDN